MLCPFLFYSTVTRCVCVCVYIYIHTHTHTHTHTYIVPCMEIHMLYICSSLCYTSGPHCLPTVNVIVCSLSLDLREPFGWLFCPLQVLSWKGLALSWLSNQAILELKNLFHSDGQVPWQVVQARLWTGWGSEYFLFRILREAPILSSLRPACVRKRRILPRNRTHGHINA